jgi:hypothetical protein
MTMDLWDTGALDGNAAAGAFGEVFAMDFTTVGLICGGCGHEGPVGALRLYGEPVGCVLRCPQCGQVNMRLMRTRSTMNLDVRGALRLTLPLAGSGSG